MKYVLGVNVDHVATLRNARNEGYPNVLEMALLAQSSGATQITAHLREDRRHIRDDDIRLLKNELQIPLNMEMALTTEMLNIALEIKPYTVCLVPERREEVTTEGGLNILANYKEIEEGIKVLHGHGIRVSIFIDAIKEQIEAGHELEADAIEINTGKYANSKGDIKVIEVDNIRNMAKYGKNLGLDIHCGHGLNLDNIASMAKIEEISEYNIGHFLVSYALIVGFENSIKDMKRAIELYIV